MSFFTEEEASVHTSVTVSTFFSRSSELFSAFCSIVLDFIHSLIQNFHLQNLLHHNFHQIVAKILSWKSRRITLAITTHNQLFIFEFNNKFSSHPLPPFLNTRYTIQRLYPVEGWWWNKWQPHKLCKLFNLRKVVARQQHSYSSLKSVDRTLLTSPEVQNLRMWPAGHLQRIMALVSHKV